VTGLIALVYLVADVVLQRVAGPASLERAAASADPPDPPSPELGPVELVPFMTAILGQSPAALRAEHAADIAVFLLHLLDGCKWSH